MSTIVSTIAAVIGLVAVGLWVTKSVKSSKVIGLVALAITYVVGQAWLPDGHSYLGLWIASAVTFLFFLLGMNAGRKEGGKSMSQIWFILALGWSVVGIFVTEGWMDAFGDKIGTINVPTATAIFAGMPDWIKTALVLAFGYAVLKYGKSIFGWTKSKAKTVKLPNRKAKQTTPSTPAA